MNILLFFSLLYFSCVSVIHAATSTPNGQPSGDPSDQPSGEPSNQPSLARCGLCGPGEYFADCNECMSCKSGYYCGGGCDVPQACPIGTYNSGYGSSSSADCVACPGGYSQPATGSSNCTACPAGHECASASDAPAPCSKGTYSTGLEASCSVCAEGSYASREGSLACTVCPAGFACADKEAGV